MNDRTESIVWTQEPPQEPGRYHWRGGDEPTNFTDLDVTVAPCGVLVVFEETSVRDWGGWWSATPIGETPCS